MLVLVSRMWKVEMMLSAVMYEGGRGGRGGGLDISNISLLNCNWTGGDARLGEVR